MSYTLERINDHAAVMVVGCGGTGGFVAEGLCRLFIGKDYSLYLVDPDRVEQRNLLRQNFTRKDLGKFKAQVLAERLSEEYGMEVNYLVAPVEELKLGDRGNLTIGCVDNPGAREILQYAGYQMMGRFSYCKYSSPSWYIDAGNSENSGQVLIGNALLRECGKGFFLRTDGTGTCGRLPLPTIQQPALLAPQPKKKVVDCAEAVALDEQSTVINQVMASLVLQFVHKLLKGSLDWMGAYLDLDNGTLSTVPATPEIVSRMTGLTVKQLVHKCK